MADDRAPWETGPSTTAAPTKAKGKPAGEVAPWEEEQPERPVQRLEKLAAATPTMQPPKPGPSRPSESPFAMVGEGEEAAAHGQEQMGREHPYALGAITAATAYPPALATSLRGAGMWGGSRAAYDLWHGKTPQPEEIGKAALGGAIAEPLLEYGAPAVARSVLGRIGGFARRPVVEVMAPEAEQAATSGVRPSPSEEGATNLVRKMIVTPEEAKSEIQALGKRAFAKAGEGIQERQARLLGLIRARRAAQGMVEPE